MARAIDRWGIAAAVLLVLLGIPVLLADQAGRHPVRRPPSNLDKAIAVEGHWTNAGREMAISRGSGPVLTVDVARSGRCMPIPETASTTGIYEDGVLSIEALPWADRSEDLRFHAVRVGGMESLVPETYLVPGHPWRPWERTAVDRTCFVRAPGAAP